MEEMNHLTTQNKNDKNAAAGFWNAENRTKTTEKPKKDNETSSFSFYSRWFSFKFVLILSLTSIISSQLLKSNKNDEKPFENGQLLSKQSAINCGLRMSQSLQSKILDAHNSIRAQVAQGKYLNKNGHFLPTAAKMFRLNWDCELEMEAQERATSCDLTKKINKTKEEAKKKLEEIRGENAFYFRVQPSDFVNGILRGIEKMGNEISEIGIESIEISKIDNRIGHAMQIIWENTQKLGCAVQECPSRDENPFDGQKYNLLVCKYFPSGNVFHSKLSTLIYTRGNTGSMCSTQKSITDPVSGLCLKLEKDVTATV